MARPACYNVLGADGGIAMSKLKAKTLENDPRMDGETKLLIWGVFLRAARIACMLAILLVLLAACRDAEREELQSVSLVVTIGIVVDGSGADPITDGLVAIQGKQDGISVD